MNLNKIFVLGNLTRDVELRSTPGGKSVASFGVATNRVWSDQGGQKQQEVEFHNVVVWGKMAELCSQYLAKGRTVLVEGRVKTRKWQDQAGQSRTKTEIIAENIQFGPKPGKSEYGSSQSNEKPNESIPEVNLDDEPVSAGEVPAYNEEESDLGSIPF